MRSGRATLTEGPRKLRGSVLEETVGSYDNDNDVYGSSFEGAVSEMAV